MPSWQEPSLIFEFCNYVILALNLRPGIDSVANFTSRIIFSDQNMKYFTLYTYNKKVPCMGLAPVMVPLVWPHDSPTAPQLSHGLHFNLISINYDILWLHSLNVVEGWMWIGKNSLNNLICDLSFLKKHPSTHTHPLISICKFSKPYKLWPNG